MYQIFFHIMAIAVSEKTKCKFKVGDKVKISPQVTHYDKWVDAVVIDVEDNSFVGYVITAETDEKVIFFEKEYLFEKA